MAPKFSILSGEADEKRKNLGALFEATPPPTYISEGNEITSHSREILLTKKSKGSKILHSVVTSVVAG